MPTPCQLHSPPLGIPIKMYTTRLRCLGSSVHWVGCGYRPATLQISSSSSELAGGMIWTAGCEMEDRREGGRVSSSYSRLLRCVIFILISVRIHYDFSYFIFRQHTSPFRTWNIATFHSQWTFSTANGPNSKISAERSRTSANCLVV